jgi:hypothetical protein
MKYKVEIAATQTRFLEAANITEAANIARNAYDTITGIKILSIIPVEPQSEIAVTQKTA